jgi:hypothetical protein
LEEEPQHPTSIGPPPRPPSLEFRDAASERWNWMQMLNRLVAGQASRPAGASADDRAVQQMLATLLDFQEAEDFIAAHHLAESGD